MTTVDELKKWLFDCIHNAQKNGLSEDGVLQAFLETTRTLLDTVITERNLNIIRNNKKEQK